MAKIQSFKRINIEDYKPEEQELIGKLAFSLNVFMEDVYNALNSSLNIADNLDMATKTFTVSVDASGNLNTAVKFKNDLKSRAQGLIPIRALGEQYVDSGVFLDYTENNGIITINNIKGLATDVEYNLTILVIGG